MKRPTSVDDLKLAYKVRGVIGAASRLVKAIERACNLSSKVEAFEFYKVAASKENMFGANDDDSLSVVECYLDDYMRHVRPLKALRSNIAASQSRKG